MTDSIVTPENTKKIAVWMGYAASTITNRFGDFIIIKNKAKGMKNKFNPEDVSGWCKWIAVDKNGECWEYSQEPFILGDIEVWCDFCDSKSSILYKGEPPKNWKKELYTWSYD